MNKLVKLLAASAIVLCTGAGNAATLIVNNGILMGATDVTVNGRSYTVAFADGRCVDVYGSCSNSSFDFNNVTDATAAAQALVDQVFIDGSAGNFDSHPELIYGGGSTGGLSTYIAYSVTGAYVSVSRAFNSFKNANDGASTYTVPVASNYASFNDQNWARFTLAAAPVSDVPEPAAWAMMISGFGMIGGALRRRRVTVARYT